MTYREAVLSAGRAYLVRTLEETGGDVTAAAKIAGVHRATFYHLMLRCGVKVERNAMPKWIEPLTKAR